MTGSASEHLEIIRDQVKTFVHGGLTLSSEDTASLVRRLNTVLELTRETEEELHILQAAMKARAAGKPSLRIIQQQEGGAA